MATDSSYRLGLDFEIPLASKTMRVKLDTESRAIAIVGPSGAGKSTILRVLAGVERRARGLVTFCGQRWQGDDGPIVPPWLRRVGWVPQEVLLFPHLTVRDNLGYAGPSAAAVEEVARLLQITELLERRPRRLSGGERQRVALGRALLAEPKLLLLDEPFSALDRPLRAELARVVGEWCAERGVPLVLVSHDEADAEVLAEQRWHLSDGKLVRE
ncbi:MAG: ATP-binding cassette domain-containing protein [Gemmatimonadetes bacterium]|jgi:molybdate transport system ATP-binding protein|nr:ATP-binding cassette domain-containing protein [Gemmatimonadota bacterium]|tara:strand:- start:2158 stop:2799 length:642 start_codon:yes stop_codon:yes gene_type:complete